MTQPANGTTLELQRIVRMLDKTAEMAQDAELTGNMGDRSAAATRTFNATLKHLADTGEVSVAIFAPLPEDASMTDVGLSSAQLAEYLRAGLPEEAQAPAKSPLVSRNLTIGNLNLGGGGDKDDISEMIREHLAEWFGEAKPRAADSATEGAAAAEPGAAASGSSAPAPGEPAARRALPSQARVEELQAQPQRAEARH